MDIREIAKVSLNLVALYTIGGLLIAGVYSVTSPIIFQKNKEEKAQALSRMLPVHLKMYSTDIEKLKSALPEGAAIHSEEEGVLDIIVDGTKINKKFLKPFKKAGVSNIVEYSDNKPLKIGDWEPWHKHAEFYKVEDDGVIKAYIVETYGKGYSSYINILVSVDMDDRIMKMEVLAHGETPGLGDEILLDYFKDQFPGKGKDQMVVIKGETKDNIQAITGATISTRAVTIGVKDALELLEKYKSGEFKPVMEDNEASGGGH